MLRALREGFHERRTARWAGREGDSLDAFEGLLLGQNRSDVHFLDEKAWRSLRVACCRAPLGLCGDPNRVARSARGVVELGQLEALPVPADASVGAHRAMPLVEGDSLAGARSTFTAASPPEYSTTARTSAYRGRRSPVSRPGPPGHACKVVQEEPAVSAGDETREPVELAPVDGHDQARCGMWFEEPFRPGCGTILRQGSAHEGGRRDLVVRGAPAVGLDCDKLRDGARTRSESS